MASKATVTILGLIAIAVLAASPAGAGAAAGPGGDFDERLPGVGDLSRLADRAWICTSGGTVYVSASNPKDWSPLQTGLPAGSAVWSCAGGSQRRLYLVVQSGGAAQQYWLYAVEPGGKPKKLRTIPDLGRLAAFCSDTTGVLSTGANVGVTVDGGATWRPSPPLFERDGAEISLLRWVGRSRLLASDGDLLGALRAARRDAPPRLARRAEDWLCNLLHDLRH